MTVGRNDPCPCGSGKKYKKCCLSSDLPASEVEQLYQRLSKSYEKLEKRLGELAYRVFGQEGPAFALDEFLGWPEGDEPVESDFLDRQGALFWPWFLFNWEYEKDIDEFELEGPEEKTIAELYAQDKGSRLDPIEQTLINAINRKPYSFWEVMGVVPGKSIDLQDILTGERITAQERTGSQTVQPADIVFGRVVPVNGVGIIFGIGATILPPESKAPVLELRLRLSGEKRDLNDDILLDWDVDIRRFYFDMERSLFQPPLLQNADGDPLEVHTLVYEIKDADAAVTELAPLCIAETEKEIRFRAERDGKGRLRKVDFPWMRRDADPDAGPETSVLGLIRLDGNRLIVEVNSANRATAIGQIIAERLAGNAEFKVDEIQDLDALMRERTEKPAAPSSLH